MFYNILFKSNSDIKIRKKKHLAFFQFFMRFEYEYRYYIYKYFILFFPNSKS